METKIRIIIADANPDFCKLLTDLTSAEEDMEVVGTASDGIEALAMLAEFMPDILLLDLVLPKLDGLEVLRRLPETGAGSHVIVLSGFVNGKVVADCSARGADYFIPKPCDPPALLSRIRQLAAAAGRLYIPPVTTAVPPFSPAGRMPIWKLSSRTLSMRSAFPPTSRDINILERRSF